MKGKFYMMVEQIMETAGPSSGKISAQHIVCPLLPNAQGFSFYKLLLKHLTDIHEVKITRSTQQFSNIEEFIVCRNKGNRSVLYLLDDKKRLREKIIVYSCNRSNTKGYVSSFKTRRKKIVGSIKMKAVCPSRTEARILVDGQVSMDFIETYIGHEDEPGIKRLKKPEELQIVKKLKM